MKTYPLITLVTTLALPLIAVAKDKDMSCSHER